MRAPLLTALLAVTLGGCGIMQSMMTKSVDQTAGAKVLGVSGEHETKRMGADGNSFSVKIEQGTVLKTADLVMGSDDETSGLLLELSAGQRARFEAADFVLRAPLGEDTDEFLATIEMGLILLDLQGDTGQRFVLIDTNKSTLRVQAPALLYVAIDDEQMKVFVKTGSASIENSRTEVKVSLKAGEGRLVDPDGKLQPYAPPEGFDWKVELKPVAAPVAAPAAVVPVAPTLPTPVAPAAPAVGEKS